MHTRDMIEETWGISLGKANAMDQGGMAHGTYNYVEGDNEIGDIIMILMMIAT